LGYIPLDCVKALTLSNLVEIEIPFYPFRGVFGDDWSLLSKFSFRWNVAEQLMKTSTC